MFPHNERRLPVDVGNEEGGGQELSMVQERGSNIYANLHINSIHAKAQVSTHTHTHTHTQIYIYIYIYIYISPQAYVDPNDGDNQGFRKIRDGHS